MRRNLYNVILKPVLKEKLNEMNTYEFKGKGYSFTDSNIEQAIRDLDEPLTSGLVKANESIYERSEEHTSELQSRGHLVCRLLLEKKKDKDGLDKKTYRILDKKRCRP